MPALLALFLLFVSALTLAGQTVAPRITAARGAGSITLPLSPRCYGVVFGVGFAGNPSVSVNGVRTLSFYADNTTVVFQVPAATAVGQASITVQTTAGTSAPFPVNIVSVAPIILALSLDNPISYFQNAAGIKELSAEPGTVLRFFVNGLGAAAPPLTPQLLIDGVDSPVLSVSTGPYRFLSLSAPPSDVDIVIFQVPAITPGKHTISIRTQSGVRTTEVPLDIFASGIILSQTGLTFNAVQGGPAPARQSFSVLSGLGAINFTASASVFSSSPTWFSATPTSGSAQARQTGVPIQVSVNPTGLAAGAYYGALQISARDVANSPQSLTMVLKVAPPGTSVGAVVDQSGLVFVASPGGADPRAQRLAVFNPTTVALSFTSQTTAILGANPFRVTPATGSIPAGQSLDLTVQVSLAGIPVGVNSARHVLTFPDGPPLAVSLLLVTAPGAISSKTDERFAGSCVPTRLLPTFTQLGESFSVPSGWPTPVEVSVVDDCGDSLTAGSVSITFSNGDPVLIMTSLRNGRWAATWPPGNPRPSNVVLTVSALQSEKKIQGVARITGGVPANPDVPFVERGGVLDAASFGPQQAPGGVISIFGGKLASGLNQASSLPFPTELKDTAVLLAGRSLPLIFTSDGQINAVVPYDIPVNASHQLIVRNGSSISTPESVPIIPARPAVITADGSGRGQGHIYRTDAEGKAALAGPSSPAVAGDALVVYCAGLGAVDPPVAAGSAASASTLSPTVNPVTVTIGGREATVFFAGLTPGASGLYQINLTVPGGLASSDTTQMIVSVAGAESVPVTMAVRSNQ